MKNCACSRDNYDLYASHAWYVPGIKGLFALWALILVGTILSFALEHFLKTFLSKDVVENYATLVSDPLIYLPAMIYVFLRSRHNRLLKTGYKPNSSHFCPFKVWQIALITVALAYAYFIVSDWINYWYFKLTLLVPDLKYMYDLITEVMKEETFGPFWVCFITTAVYAAIFEEWLCRGILLRGLLAKMSPLWAIVISALFFSLIHMNPWQGLNAFLFGLMIGYVYYKTGSLWLTMLLHLINNGTVVVLAQIPSLRETEWIMDMMPLATFVVVYVLAVVALLACLMAFRRIPLEHKRGNIDAVLNPQGAHGVEDSQDSNAYVSENG